MSDFGHPLILAAERYILLRVLQNLESIANVVPLPVAAFFLFVSGIGRKEGKDGAINAPSGFFSLISFNSLDERFS